MRRSAHFIGIGGIGVSALAQYYLANGWEVSGCDLGNSEITEQLKKLGAKIRIGKPKASDITSHTEMVVYSPAVRKTHPELKRAYKMGGGGCKMKIVSYPQAVGELTKTHYTIAISGTHGKSTTTAMIGLLLTKAGLNPTVIVGTKLKEFGNSNFRMGGYPNAPTESKNTKYLVIEADEHFASFLHYSPRMIVLTAIEADHLDYYKNLKNIIKTFSKYVLRLPRGGILIANADDLNTKKILALLKNPTFPITTYSLSQKEAGTLRKILKIPGEHNVANALAAFATARALKIPDKISIKALGAYKGSWRRFEIFHLKHPVPYTLVSDYGHHPTKIRVTIQAARSKWPKRKIWLFYQPHQYARTYYLFQDFVNVFSTLPIEKLILTDIFDVAGRENAAIRRKISSRKLFEAVKKKGQNALEVLYIPSRPPFEELKVYLQENLKGGEVVMVMGAGDIYNFVVRLTALEKRKKIE